MDEKERRIVEARLRLRERFQADGSRAGAAARPRGAGAANRHGMPKLPVGQTQTHKWPVLDLGRQPRIARERWHLVVDGAVEERLDLDWNAFQALPQVADTSDFHCVTGWSRLDLRWRGVRVSEVLARARP